MRGVPSNRGWSAPEGGRVRLSFAFHPRVHTSTHINKEANEPAVESLHCCESSTEKCHVNIKMNCSVWKSLFCILIGVLEEARFFGIDSLIEHLEVAIKVRHFLILIRITFVLNDPMTPIDFFFLISFSRIPNHQRIIHQYPERNLFDFCWPLQPSQSCAARCLKQTVHYMAYSYPKI